MGMSRRAQQQRRHRRQRCEAVRRERRQQRHTRPAVCEVEFSLADPTPAGSPVRGTEFAGLSHDQQVVIDQVMGFAPHLWNDMITQGVLDAAVTDSEPIIYLVSARLLHGPRDCPADGLHTGYRPAWSPQERTSTSSTWVDR
jgi:hypothetical protein